MPGLLGDIRKAIVVGEEGTREQLLEDGDREVSRVDFHSERDGETMSAEMI